LSNFHSVLGFPIYPMTNKIALLLLAAVPCFAAERASYDTAGTLTSLISSGVELPVHGEIMVKFTGAPAVTAQPHDQRSPVTRSESVPRWEGTVAFPNGSQAQMAVAWAESDAGVTLDASLTAKSPFPGAAAFKFPVDVEAVDYVIDLPRSSFVGWHIDPTGQVLSAVKPADPTFYSATAPSIAFSDPRGNWKLSITFDQPRKVTVTDTWDGAGRSFRVRISMLTGTWMVGDSLKVGLTLALAGTPSAPPASLSVDPTAALYPFDGFGGNYRVYAETPVVDYTLDNLHLSWARFEFKAVTWDRDRTLASPGPQLQSDFALMQRVQRMGVPWIISLWYLPERFYTDPNQKPFGTFGRQIAADRWPEFLDLLGTYLVYLKQHYGAEPDLFSFNESDLGVNVGFTAETHRDEIKRIGAYLAKLGLKTKMLLGDTANPRDSHKFVLAAAADPEAMRYVGAISVHSWGNGTPEQYGAWGDVAEWLNLPLLVAEAGVDPGAYKNKMFDSFSYGLKEARQFQELLRYARPQALIYWQFTDDYGLVRVGTGGALEPTGRFWLMKQFVNLTPPRSEAIGTSSDQPDVLLSGFLKGDSVVVHILNTGADREASVSGLPGGSWRTVTTTESSGYQEGSMKGDEAGGPRTIHLPARSLTTLVRE
jgi:O-glycosyl hydrolase